MGGWEKLLRLLVTEPRVTGGEVTRRGKLLGCKRCERRARKHDPKASFVVQI